MSPLAHKSDTGDVKCCDTVFSPAVSGDRLKEKALGNGGRERKSGLPKPPKPNAEMEDPGLLAFVVLVSWP